jgi:hypothetical protein
MGDVSCRSRASAKLPSRRPPDDASRLLSECLLGSEMVKRRQLLTIRFDDQGDSSIVHKTLCSLRDAYVPPRK